MLREVDYQINLDPGGRGNRALREAYGTDRPLVETAAETLSEAMDDRPVFLTTGFPVLPGPNPETDGPVGTAVLARALADLGARPVFVTEPHVEECLVALADELDLADAAVETLPEGTAADSQVGDLFERHDPTAVVAVEKPGRSSDGAYRNMNGEDITASVADLDAVVEHAAREDVPTVGVGDGGNEIGMGAISDTVADTVPHGGTIAAVTAVDHLVVAGVSNWGAYGLVCGLSALAGENLLHDGATERRLIERSVDAGAVDGVTGEAVHTVDDLAAAFHADLVDVLDFICERAIAAGD